MIYNTYEDDIKIYGDFDIPIPTYDMSKKIDFSVIVALLLRSNSNNKTDSHRYIDFSRINKKAICDECNICMRTLKTKLKYLEEKNILATKNTSRGLIYIINYSKNGKYYVTINHRILRKLLLNTNKNVIRVYLLLKIQCDILNNKRPMSNAYLCSLLGRPTNNNRNIDDMGKWTNTLVELDLIEKKQYRVYHENHAGKRVVLRTDTYYTIKKIVQSI